MDVVIVEMFLDKLLCSNIYEIKEEMDELTMSLKKVLEDESVFFDIRLILNELVINGIFHGNNSDSSKKVCVSIRIQNGYIEIKVKDEGDGFLYNERKYNSNNLGCCGRGLKIVTELSDEFHVDGNTVTAIKYM